MKQIRRRGGGRAPLRASIDEGLLSYYDKLTLTIGSICPRSLLFLKKAQLADAGKNLDPADLYHAFGEDGAAKRARANNIVARWMERRKPYVRETNRRRMLPFAGKALQDNCFSHHLTRKTAD